MSRRWGREPAVRAVLMALGSLVFCGQLLMLSRGREESLSEGVAFSNHPPVRQEAFLRRRMAEDCLVAAVVQVESGGQARKIGRAGERGLMQIKPETWREVSGRFLGEALPFDRAFDPEINLMIGRAYLNELRVFLAGYRARWKSDERTLLLACYNAGPSRVMQDEFDPARCPASTRDYIRRVAALHDHYLAEEPPNPSVRLAWAMPGGGPSRPVFQ